jgi:hypothetical protein
MATPAPRPGEKVIGKKDRAAFLFFGQANVSVRSHFIKKLDTDD